MIFALIVDRDALPLIEADTNLHCHISPFGG